jgi:hypothetical protein
MPAALDWQGSSQKTKGRNRSSTLFSVFYPASSVRVGRASDQKRVFDPPETWAAITRSPERLPALNQLADENTFVTIQGRKSLIFLQNSMLQRNKVA